MVVCLDFGGQQRSAQVVFQDVCDAVQELEDLQGLRVGRAWRQEEQLVLDDGVEEGGGIGGGEVDKRWSRSRVGQVEGQEGAARGRAAVVRVFEEGVAGPC